MHLPFLNHLSGNKIPTFLLSHLPTISPSTLTINQLPHVPFRTPQWLPYICLSHFPLKIQVPLVLFMGTGAPSHTGGYYYGSSVMILMVTFYFNEHIYHIFLKIHLFPPMEKKQLFFVFWGVGKKTSTQCIWHLENKYYKDGATAFSSKLGSLVYIKCFNTHIVSGGQFHPQWGKMLFLGVKNKTKPLLFMYKTQIKHIVVVHRTHKQIYSTVVVYNSLGRRNGD